jgi:hypothetical protein
MPGWNVIASSICTNLIVEITLLVDHFKKYNSTIFASLGQLLG